MEHRSPPVERKWTVGRAGCWSAPTHLAPDWSTVAFSSATAAARRSVRTEEALRPRAGSPGRCSHSSRKRARDAAAGEREGAERPGLRRLGLLAPFDVTRRIPTQHVTVKMRLRRSVHARDGSVHCEIQLAFAVPRKVERNRRTGSETRDVPSARSVRLLPLQRSDPRPQRARAERSTRLRGRPGPDGKERRRGYSLTQSERRRGNGRRRPKISALSRFPAPSRVPATCSASSSDDTRRLRREEDRDRGVVDVGEHDNGGRVRRPRSRFAVSSLSLATRRIGECQLCEWRYLLRIGNINRSGLISCAGGQSARNGGSSEAGRQAPAPASSRLSPLHGRVPPRYPEPRPKAVPPPEPSQEASARGGRLRGAIIIVGACLVLSSFARFSSRAGRRLRRRRQRRPQGSSASASRRRRKEREDSKEERSSAAERAGRTWGEAFAGRRSTSR
jgi:hypothetical protein